MCGRDRTDGCNSQEALGGGGEGRSFPHTALGPLEEAAKDPTVLALGRRKMLSLRPSCWGEGSGFRRSHLGNQLIGWDFKSLGPWPLEVSTFKSPTWRGCLNLGSRGVNPGCLTGVGGHPGPHRARAPCLPGQPSLVSPGAFLSRLGRVRPQFKGRN